MAKKINVNPIDDSLSLIESAKLREAKKKRSESSKKAAAKRKAEKNKFDLTSKKYKNKS